jgi:hypothetical protein
LKADLRSLLHDDSLSDVTFVVEDIPVPAHKIMMTRSTYFRAMLMGDMMESSQSLIRINEVRIYISNDFRVYFYLRTCWFLINSYMLVSNLCGPYCFSYIYDIGSSFHLFMRP